jgi:hypothetical protein
MKKRFIIPIIIVTLFTQVTMANHPGPDTIRVPMFELIRVVNNTAYSSLLHFKATVTYSDVSDDVTVSQRTDTASCTVNGKKFLYASDSMLVTQNDYYQLYFNPFQTVMMISNASTVIPFLFQTNILSETFGSYIDSLSITDSSHYRKLNIVFRETAPYLLYTILYDTSTRRAEKIVYRIKKEINGIGDETAFDRVQHNFVQYQVLFSDYETLVGAPPAFSLSSYFTVEKGIFYPAPAFSGYRLTTSFKTR